jgi:cellulose synthase/poly-beta-1,6-N-acetylglucosamine synthase-like glycosyltransferase
MIALEILFWLCFGVMFLTYIGYPILLKLIGVLGGDYKGEKILKPNKVTMIVSLYNEISVLDRKISNCVSLKTEGYDFSVILADDCSDDGSGELCRDWAQKMPELFRVVRGTKRTGKNITLRLALSIINEGIVVFSDANSHYEEDALHRLIEPFRDPAIGCVVGQLRYHKGGKTLEGAYWRYEHMVKHLESRLGAMVVGNGSIIASRYNLLGAIHLPVANDLTIPLDVNRAGARSIFQDKAVAWEHMSTNSGEEFQRKLRMATRGLSNFKSTMSRAMGLMKAQYLIHKVFRWTSGAFLITLLAVNLPLAFWTPFWTVALALQAAFYGSALMGWFLEKMGKKASILMFSWYFCVMHAAGIIALFRVLRGQQAATWEKPESTRVNRP